MTSTYLNHTQKFKNHLRVNLKEGITCSGEPGKYVPCSVLRKYWKRPKIRSLLQEANILGPKPELIFNNYLRVFSILVYTSTLHLLQSLISAQKQDSTLPWPQSLDFLDATDQEYHALFSTQWKFCPVLLDPDHELCDTRLHGWSILPFEEKESAQEPRPTEREATTKIMVVHKDAHAHLPRKDEVSRLVFLKIYEQEYHEVYDLEASSNSAFASEDIATCIGSFHWFGENSGRTSTLIFEYAERGTLLDLYRQSLKPYLPEHIKAFWKGILGVLKGLLSIHESEGNRIALHHDMKPSNILVYSNGLFNDNHVYQFKIGDFGASYFIHSSVNLQPINRGTTRTYAPPEIHLGDSVKYMVGPKLDMWSIGCIIFEAAVWVTFGERGRQDFKRKRQAEILELPDLKDLGYGDCFHDGSVALNCIKEYADLMKDLGHQGDEITRQIVKLAMRDLLVERDSRIDSGSLHGKMRAILHGERPPKVSSPTRSTEVDPTRSSSTVRIWGGIPPLTGQNEPGIISPREQSEDESISKMSTQGSGSTQPVGSTQPSDSTQPVGSTQPSGSTQPNGSTHPNGSTQPVGPGGPTNFTANSAHETEVYIDQLSFWIKSKKILRYAEELPGWKLTHGLLKGRDFIFLIDNSKSMQKYKEEVLRWVSELGYLVKDLDPDGVEIRCTSDHTKIVKFTRSKEAKNFVSGRFADGEEGPCDMENALFSVAHSIREPPPSSRLSFTTRSTTRSGSGPKRTSVLVFTDGVWNSSSKYDLMGADGPIESLIKHMKEKDMARPNISIQFLRFGSDPVGISRLESLDDDLGEKHKFDIVDHKPVTACIWKILIGAVSKSTD